MAKFARWSYPTRMADPTAIPHLLRLLDDESPEVRTAVAREFASFGEGLKDELDRLTIPPSVTQRHILQWMLEDYGRSRLRRAWRAWLDAARPAPSPAEDIARLERGLTLLADFQSGIARRRTVTEVLDALAEEYVRSRGQADVRVLSEFLFQERALRGTLPTDFYNPLNSNVVYLAEEGRGLPITLCCAYMLVGARLGLDVWGINFPGHFLARVVSEGRPVIVDCFHGGKFFSEDEIVVTHKGPPAALRRLLRVRADAKAILARILRNLVGAYEKAGSAENAALTAELLKDTDGK